MQTIVFLLLLTGSVFLTAADFSAGNYYKKHWGVENGLPQNSIYSLAQDFDGYLWLGTYNGAVRFDGQNMQLFDRYTEPAITSNYIRNITISPDGSLYLSSPDPQHGSVVRYFNNKFKEIDELKAVSEKTFQTTMVDRSGRLWIATREQGIARIDQGQLRLFGVPEGVPAGRIAALFEDSQGTVWAGAWEGGVVRFYDNRFEMPNEFKILQKTTISSITENTDGALLFSTYREGLYQYHKKVLTNYRFPVEGEVWINALYPAADNTVWIATRSEGLYVFQNGTLVKSILNKDIRDFHIRSIVQSADRTLWVGTYTDGLYQFTPTYFNTIGTRDGLSDYSVVSLVEDQEGTIWIGTHNKGLNRYKNGVLEPVALPGPMPAPGIRTMLVSRDGSLWIGTEGAGLIQYAAGIFTAVSFSENLLSNVIYALYEDRAGNIWVGLANGTIRVGGPDGRFSPFDSVVRKSSDSVFMILEDRTGALWFLSAAHLTRFREGKAAEIPVSVPGGMSHLYEDTKGNLLLGTYAGLGLWQNGAFSFIGKTAGLHDEAITSIIEDSTGFLWLASSRGIFRVNGEELLEVFNKKRTAVHSEVFGISDGLPGLECNEGQRSVLKTKNGRLWFSTVRGASMADPLQVAKKQEPVRTKLEAVTVEGMPAELNKKGLFSADKQRFEFSFTGIEFIAPEKISFRYRLEGSDSDWNTGKKERRVTYHLASPGNYTFRVAACFNAVCGEEAVYYFSRAARWHQSWLGFLLPVLVLGSAAYLFYRRRMKKAAVEISELQEVAEERKQELEIITEELKEKYETSRLEEDTAQSMLRELARYMDEKKPYLDSTLRLRKVSEDTGIAPHYISQVLNVHQNKNFYTFVNEYRIEEAKKILADPQRNSNILDAAFQSGFNSKTAFNTIFKKMTGMTPRDYIKQKS